ncbi:hypothetical protein T440DRAFT_402574 [Plenodomus tracheiphilus IPT5]|uniref:Uncharacterized protein n=1 Tax=Plenodomus tracheiphilus IPT5 TaxID=1408161 RepID=A0A6A7AX74_9PLEO|nr:hypothetical protein T440DRAFT_402574 [Plenodomus tracheiphilus IPT5]
MSDTEKVATPTAGAAPQFTERELQLLGWAMQSLKSGPPEIDNEKLAAFAGMSNHRSAGNAWAKLKNKLMAPSDGSVPPATPKKAGGRKKAVKDDGGENGEVTPKKTGTPRKRVAKKQDVDGGDASPKKKSRAKCKYIPISSCTRLTGL